MKAKKVNPLRKKSENVVDELYGSLKTNVPYVDMETARKKVGIALGKKYSIKRITKKLETFDKNLQKLK